MFAPRPVLDSHNASVRSSFSIHIPADFILAPKTRTNSTVTGMTGPGRTVGSILTSAGRRFERVIDRFAEGRLGMGPNMAALRLTASLHHMHASGSRECRSDHVVRMDDSTHVMDRLIWACNGCCSQCRKPYLPAMLSDAGIPNTVRRCLVQLINHVRVSGQPLTNIALAAVYIHLLAESRILSPSLLDKLGVVETLRHTTEALMLQILDYRQLPAEILALKAASLAIVKGNISSRAEVDGAVSRFPSSVTYEEINVYSYLMSESTDWMARHIAFAKLLTNYCLIASNHIQPPEAPDSQELIDMARYIPENFDLSSPYLLQHAASIHLYLIQNHIMTTSRILESEEDQVNTVAFSTDGSGVLSGGSDRTMRLWDVNSAHRTTTFTGHTRSVFSVSFAPNGTHFASGSDDETVRVWDLKTGAETAAFTGHGFPVVTVAFSPHCTHVASGSKDCTVRIWDLEAGLAVGTLEHRDTVNSVAFSMDGAHLVCGVRDMTVRLWDLEHARQTAALKGHNDRVQSVSFCPDGTRFASSSWDSTGRLWDRRTARQTAVLAGHRDWVHSIVFSPDGSQVLSGSRDGTVRLWDLRNSQPLAILDGHDAWVKSVAFSPQGTHIASASDDGMIRVWEVDALTSPLCVSKT